MGGDPAVVVAAGAYQGALKYYASKSTVDWPHDLAAAKAQAAASGKPLPETLRALDQAELIPAFWS